MIEIPFITEAFGYILNLCYKLVPNYAIALLDFALRSDGIRMPGCHTDQPPIFNKYFAHDAASHCITADAVFQYAGQTILPPQEAPEWAGSAVQRQELTEKSLQQRVCRFPGAALHFSP